MAAFFCPQTEELSGQHWYGISYLRLSKLGKRYESESIDNQRKLIHEFVQRHPEITLVGEQVDDGYTGTNYDRPGFRGVMDAIREKKANCVIVKDLSRLGREYIETGKYLETVFPDMGIRFISVNDDLDSEHTPLCDDISIPIKNIMNEAYCRSLSQKLRAQFRVQRKAGEFLGAFACYGYLKDPEDNMHWIVDEEAAKVVQTIFDLCMKGYGPSQIAQELHERQIPVPTAHLQSIGVKTPGKVPDDIYAWSPRSVADILDKQEYLGHTVNFKTHKKSFKIKKKINNDPSEWAVFENTHEAIIEQGVFDAVKRIRDGRRRVDRLGAMPMLSGMLFCADCGAKLYQVRGKDWPHEKEYFVCASYRKVKGGCSSHQIRNVVIEQLLLDDLQRVTNYARNHEAEFMQLVTKSYEKALENRERKTYVAHNLDEITADLEKNGDGFIKAMWCGDEACEEKVKEITVVGSRCIPLEQEHLDDKCVCCGKPAKCMVYWGKAY